MKSKLLLESNDPENTKAGTLIRMAKSVNIKLGETVCRKKMQDTEHIKNKRLFSCPT